MARQRELGVVLRGVDAHRMRLEHALPEVRDLARRPLPVSGRRDVHDRTLEQVDPRGGEAMRVRARQRVAAGEAGPDPQPVRPGDDRPLHGAHVGDQRARADVRLEADEQLRLAAGGAARTRSSTARATSAARGGASSIAPWRAAATRSAGSGDQPSTVAIPARFAWRASEPPIAPRPMMPRVLGRTGWKLAAAVGPANDEGRLLVEPP